MRDRKITYDTSGLRRSGQVSSESGVMWEYRGIIKEHASAQRMG